MKKRILSIIVSCLMVFCNMNFVFGADISTKQITIIHTNDTHSRILDTDGEIYQMQIICQTLI